MCAYRHLIDTRPANREEPSSLCTGRVCYLWIARHRRWLYCTALSLSRGGSLTYHKLFILKVIKKVIQDHQTEKSHYLCALAECAIYGQPDTAHHSLTGIKGSDEETRKERYCTNAHVFYCQNFRLFLLPFKLFKKAMDWWMTYRRRVRGGSFLTVDALFMTRPRVHTRPFIRLTQRPAATTGVVFAGTLCVEVGLLLSTYM